MSVNSRLQTEKLSKNSSGKKKVTKNTEKEHHRAFRARWVPTPKGPTDSLKKRFHSNKYSHKHPSSFQGQLVLRLLFPPLDT